MVSALRRRSEEKNRELVETAVAAGCRAIALTVDVQYTSYRERVLHDRNLVAAPSRSTVPELDEDATAQPYSINGRRRMWMAAIDQLRGFTKVLFC